MIWGRHPVWEALRGGRPINKIMVASHLKGVGEILSLARERGIPIQRVDRKILDKIASGGSHQGLVALVAEKDYAQVQDLLYLAEAKGEAPLLVVLDHVEDPQNLGAIIRSAEAAGAHGVIIPSRRSAGLTPAVAKASAGALEYLPIARVNSLPALLRDLKSQGLWIFGAEGKGEEVLYEADLTLPLALVFGSEGQGLSPGIRKCCHLLLKIPMRGQMESLNVAAAAAVFLFEAVRQRYYRRGRAEIG